MLLLIVSILTSLIPHHDFHTSWMNMTYNEGSKFLESEWLTDTEHLEAVLTNYSGKEIILDDHTVSKHTELLERYINDHLEIDINNKTIYLEIEVIQLTFAEITVRFKPISQRRKIRTMDVQNSLLLHLFPNQKNMVQVNYCGEKKSLLLSAKTTLGTIAF